MNKFKVILFAGIMLLIGQIIVFLLPLRPRTGPVGEPGGLDWQGLIHGLCIIFMVIAVGYFGLMKDKDK